MAWLTRFRAIVAAAVLVGVAVAGLVTWPATQSLRNGAALDNATTQLLRQAASSGDGATAKEWVRRIPATSNGSVAAQIAAAAAQAGLDNVNVQAGGASTYTVDTFAGVLPVTAQTYTLTGQGTVSEVAQFLTAVGQLTPMVSVTEATLSPSVELSLVSYTAPLQDTVERLR